MPVPAQAGDLSDLSNATFSRVFSWNSNPDNPQNAPDASNAPPLGLGMLDASDSLLTMPEPPDSRGAHGGHFPPDQPFSGGSLGLPDPPRSSGSQDSRSLQMPDASGRQSADSLGRQGGIWEVDALTIPSMCDQNVRMRGEWGSNIMGGSWGRNLVLPGLAGLSGEPLGGGLGMPVGGDSGPSPSSLRGSPF
eukprot:2175457-Rhodomonas_salina.1